MKMWSVAVSVLLVLGATPGLLSCRSVRPEAVGTRLYPAAFFFRSAEQAGPAINAGRLTYEHWDAQFSRLGGIMGKSLEEEVPGRSANIPYFTRFKTEHPDQTVLLHYNGNARDPRDGSTTFFPGHWIYFNGSRLTRDLPAAAGESEMHVADSSLFRTAMGRYGDKNEDIGICRLGPNGHPDWSSCEQVELLSVDAKRNVLRVRRGCFGTKPLSFRAGAGYAAAHVTEGPWGKHSHLLWYYNYSTHCPRDASGRRCGDVLAEDLARHFLPGGDLAAFDGVEFDVLHNNHGSPHAQTAHRGADMDADGLPDWGYLDGVNTYGIGVVDFCGKLRRKVGDATVLQADGANWNSQRAFAFLNGIESEGWPHLSDWEIRDWSGGMNRHRFWASFARPPVFNYINHKFVTHGAQPGSTQRPEVPYARHRLVFAAAQCFDAVITYAYAPPRDDDKLFGVWDELRQGAEHRPLWLGRALGPPRNLAREHPDLLAGAWRRPSRWQGQGCRIEETDSGIKVATVDDTAEDLRFRLKDVPTDGRDLTVCVTMTAAALKDTPASVPRLVWVGIAPGRDQLITPESPTVTGQCLRGGPERPLDADTGADVRFFRAHKLAGESHNAYRCHPPYKTGVGYTFWERTVAVPAAGELHFYTGLSEKAATRSDGVTFRIQVKTNGTWEPVFDQHIRAWQWTEHSASLARWSGRKVQLRFVTDCGPRDNSTTDHAMWGDIRVRPTGIDTPVTKAVRHMTFAGDQAFESTFYFREIRSQTVNLAFSVEGRGPVRISALTAHAFPELLIREFEHGLVLGNPALHEAAFDLAALVPAGHFHRLQGSPVQDPKTNNGQPVGTTVTLGERDGLFLVRVRDDDGERREP